MKMREIGEIINKLKQSHKKLYTNIIWSNFKEDQEIEEIFENSKGVIFVISKPTKKTAYYAVADRADIIPLLANIQDGVVLEYHYRKENDMDSIFKRANMQHYANYFRVTTVYKESPYGKENGKKKILNDLYDEDCGEYPDPEDAVELEQLTRKVFDPLTDDIYTVKEWQKIIREKECLIIRENGHIVTYYVWHLEGKKLYSNLSVNLGPANYMYNLERRVFERMWNMGIRIYYAWYNMGNSKTLKRNGLSTDMGDLYQAIYIKS